MAPGQDWCLNCGAGAPGSVAGAGWRSLGAVLAVAAVLVLAAAAAGYAALSKKARHAPLVVTTVAQATPAPAASTPPTTTTPPLPGLTTKPPKIPLKAATPTPASTTPTVTPTTPAQATTPATTESPVSAKPVEEPPREAILLDTDAASTYDPYAYPAAWFGDPSLAIDGDTTTGWTALVEPTVAPKMAEGLVIDLNTPRKLSAVALTTSTRGMTVQVYASAAATLPASITDPAWVALTPSFVEHKRHVRITLGAGSAAATAAAKRAYRFVTLWISQAPPAAVGTAAAPGRVSVNELELFPRKK
jgi:hypothetical protein